MDFFGLFEEPGKDTVVFLGMHFKCNQEYFIKTIKEEVEDLFLVPYLTLWLNYSFLVFIGWFPLMEKFQLLAYSIRERWNAGVNAVAARGINQYALYVLFQSEGKEWMICDPIMLKYWVFHAINIWIPELRWSLFGSDDEPVEEEEEEEETGWLGF